MRGQVLRLFLWCAGIGPRLAPKRFSVFIDSSLGDNDLAEITELQAAGDAPRDDREFVGHGRLEQARGIETVRGRNGGLRLNREPDEINIGEVVRLSEPDFYMAACFESEHSSCAHHGQCLLTPKLAQATQAYLKVLDGVTLADLLPAKAGPSRGAGVHPITLHRTARRAAKPA
jgi:hypothetical protein